MTSGVHDSEPPPGNGLTYRAAGVDIAAADALVETIKPLARATHRRGVIGGLGGFGALFDLKAAGFVDPVLVSGTDGVGTKLKVAIETGIHDTVGVDLVAMCVNDIVVQGAEPLFFLDYFATGRLDPRQAREVIAGIASGCNEAGCALVGGETAEMPGLYRDSDYDLAGFAVGAAERGHLLPHGVAPGDTVLGLASSGVHSNAFSLVRRVVEVSGLSWGAPAPFDPEVTLGQALMVPTRIYVPALLALHRAGLVKAAAHITGGGLPGNLPRVLPEDTVAVLRAVLVGSAGVRLAGAHWRRGARGDAAGVQLRHRHGGGGGGPRCRDRTAARPGRERRQDRPDRSGQRAARGAHRAAARLAGVRRRTAVLISGRGSNMAALAAAAHDPSYPAEIALVVANRPDATGLALAHAAGIAAAAIDHRPFRGDRAAHEAAIDAALQRAGIEIVCLAGYMRLLTPRLIDAWQGRMLNVHPSLLPAFPGLDTHARALAAGVKLHGCTVHLVTQEVDAGPILAQAAVPVLPGDTAETLAERVLTQEHRIYPAALRCFAAGTAGSAAPAGAVLANPVP